MQRLLPVIMFVLSAQVSAFDEVDLKKLWKTNACPACALTGVDLHEIFLKGANLHEADLRGKFEWNKPESS